LKRGFVHSHTAPRAIAMVSEVWSNYELGVRKSKLGLRDWSGIK
jgi:hypothetical protein